MAALQKKKKKKERNLEWKGGGWEEKAATAINAAGCVNCPFVA